MSKKSKKNQKHHKEKHTKAESYVSQPHTETPVLPQELQGKALKTKPKRFWLLAAVFFFGILVGVLVGMFVLHLTPQDLYAGMTSKIEKEEDYLTEPDVLDTGTATGTPVSAQKLGEVTILPSSTTSIHYFIVGNASATSSPLSVHVPTMIYHSVRPYMKGESKYQDQYDVTPELLEEELIYLRDNGYTAVDYRDLTSHWGSSTAAFPKKPVILSFDDGWKNQYVYAYPLLKKYHMKAVFFVFTNPIDHKNKHWMSWSEVKELDAAGFEIGGHSRTHPVLTKIKDDAMLDHEIRDAKQVTEKELGHPIVSFAYPFGMENDQVLSAVTRAGYVIARTTYSGVWNDPEHALVAHGTISSDHIKDFVRLLEKP